MEARVIRHLPSGWSDTIVVCGKCSKKLDGGFGAKGRQTLAKALRERPGVGRGRKAAVGVVETKCLGVCPKRAVVVGRAGGWLVVPAGTPVERVAVELGLGRSPDDGGGAQGGSGFGYAPVRDDGPFSPGTR